MTLRSTRLAPSNKEAPPGSERVQLATGREGEVSKAMAASNIAGRAESTVKSRRSGVQPKLRAAGSGRGTYMTLQQVVETYPVFTMRLLRRLVQERRIAFSRVGRCIILSEVDIEAYLESNRVERARWGATS